MLDSYLRVAWRALRKRIGPTVINVFGLAIGLAACLLIGLWIQHELRYDDFHPDAERTYRVAIDTEAGGNAIYAPQTPVPLKAALRRDVPEVEAVTQFRDDQAAVLRRGDQAFTDNTVVYADSTFLDVFGGFALRHGDREAALDGAGALVLTPSTAERLFGRVNAVGESVQLAGETRQVTGIVDELPETSHLQFDAIASYTSVPPVFRDNWTGFRFYTYTRLNPNASQAAFEAKLSEIATQYGAADVHESFGFPMEEISYSFFAEPLTDIHLYSDFNSVDAGGSITTVYVFAAIGLFILMIACINFMNLATARASERATEVGMRKALGARRPQLMGQFFGEAVLTTAAATVLALAAAAGTLPLFNDIAGTNFGLGAFLQPTIVVGALLLVAVVGLVSGSYPAIALSRFMPAKVLRAGGPQSTGGADQRFRQGLVVFQFAISIALIAGTLVAQQQFDYIQTKRLGLDTERVVEIERARDLGARQDAFVDRVRRMPGVTAASAGGGLFGGTSGNAFWPADSSSTASQVLRFFAVGPRFTETMDIEVAVGRSFDPARPADSSAVLLNRAAVAAYGFDAPLDQQITPGDSVRFDVIGVVDNFHFQSMRQEVAPAALFLGSPFDDTPPNSVYARLAAGPDPSETLSTIRSAWTGMAGASAPFQYSFLDQTYDELHRDVQRAGTLFSLFAGLAVVIACLGLFGLATYTVQRRRKEIGIRKALGATVTQIVGLLSKQFLALVGAGALIALPVAYWGLERWLQDFAYRTSVGPGVLGSAAGLAALVALLAISYHALRAARLNPATTLQEE
jgi:putative ABC transport system permease protein